MKRPIGRHTALILGLLAAGSSLTLAGCEDPIEPGIWGNFPDTVELYSLARAEYVDRPSAYTILQGNLGPVIIERLGPIGLSPYSFDIAVTEDEAGAFQLLPTGYFPGANVRSGIQKVEGATFEGLERAPRDEYVAEEPVEAELGAVYALRSRQTNSGCYYYGKMEILDLDPAGIATIRVLANVNCSDRSLVPNAPEPDDDES